MNLTPVRAKEFSKSLSFHLMSVFVLALMLQLSIIPSTQAASASFDEITGPTSGYVGVWSVSPDGSVVVGQTNSITGSYTEAFSWTRENGIKSLGVFPEYSSFSRAHDVSINGDTIVGYIHYKYGNVTRKTGEGFRITKNRGLEFLPNNTSFYSSHSAGMGVSDDGKVTVGFGTPSSQTYEAVRWDDSGNIRVLSPIDHYRDKAVATSFNGDVIVGSHNSLLKPTVAFRWSKTSGFQLLGSLNDAVHPIEAKDVSGNGDFIVGDGKSSSGKNEAFIWTKGGSAQLLGKTIRLSRAYAVTNDGSIVVGYDADIGSFIWDFKNGKRSLKSVFETEYGLDLAGWFLTGVVDISADGLVIVGNGFYNGGQVRGWIVHLDALPTANTAPIANAGSDQTVSAGTVVQLDANEPGNPSSDPDGNYPLTYLWTLIVPPDTDSAAVLSDSTSAIPTFTTDVLGDYKVTLIVTDSKGKSSAPDEVIISTVNSAPIAKIVVKSPGLEVIEHKTTVQLDGGGSTDPDGDTLTFSWTLTPPDGSVTTLVNAGEIMPSFKPDVHSNAIDGNYVVTLTVTDPHGATDTATVTITFDNIPPVASATYAEVGQVLIEGDTINLSGSGSDQNLDTVPTYTWTLIPPAGSAAVLSSDTVQNPSFVADIAGDYAVELIVQDNHGLASASFSLVPSITVITQAQAVDNALTDLVTGVTTLAPAVFDNANQQNALSNKLDAVFGLIDQGKYKQALDKLQNDILGKTDGCANSGGVSPDGNDWIDSCTVQAEVYPLVIDLIYFLSK